MQQVIKNEWQYLLRTPWLWVLSGLFVMVLFVSVFLGAVEQRLQSDNYQKAQEHLRAQWESIEAMNPHGAAHYGTYVFKPRGLLSALDEGVQRITGNVLRVEGHVQNEIAHAETAQMQSVSTFGKLRSALLLQFIVPILLIFLAFNAVSSEKRAGRLKLLLLQGTTYAELLFAKTLAVWSYGFGLLVLTVLAYTALNGAALDQEILRRVLLFVLVYALYYFIVTGLTIYFSAQSENPTLALTSMLGIWMLWSILLPNMVMSAVEKQHPLPSRNQMQTAMKTDRAQGVDGHNPSDERKKEFEKQVLASYGVGSLDELPVNFDGLLMQADEEYGNLVWDKHFGALGEVLEQQKRTFQFFGAINPFAALQNSSMGVTGNDNYHHQDFLVQVERYRRVFIKTLNDEHAFGGSKTGDWQWKADNAFFKSVPDFEYQAVAIKRVMSFYWIDLGMLLLWFLGVAWLLGRYKWPVL
jgi:ABC-2 type transport system permease protein